MSTIDARSTVAFSVPPRFIGLPSQVAALSYSLKEYDSAVSLARDEGREAAQAEFEAERVKLREHVSAVVDGAFSRIQEKHESALSQMRALLPQLVSEATKRVVAGIAVDASLVKAVVRDLLEEVAPGAEMVEVQLCASDLARVTGFDEELRHKFPSIHLMENRELVPGDCVVRTRFGVIDGRISSKLKAVEGLLS